MTNIQNFLEYVLTPFNTQHKEFSNDLIEGHRFWMKLKDIKQITKTITDTNFDIFLKMGKII